MKRIILFFLFIKYAMIALMLLVAGSVRAINVNGVVKASSLPDNAELTMIGNTQLQIDVDKTITSISGPYALTISGTHALTVNATYGTGGVAIKAYSLYSSADLNVYATATGITVDNDMEINGGKVTARCAVCGFYVLGKLTIRNATVDVSAQLEGATGSGFDAIDVTGDYLQIDSHVKALSSPTANSSAIYCRGGSVIVSGGVLEAEGGAHAICTLSRDIQLAGQVKAINHQAAHAILSELAVNCADDIYVVGVSGIYAGTYLRVLSGKVEVHSSTWGLMGKNVDINGDVTIVSGSTLNSCDGIVASEQLTITGGTIDVDAKNNGMKSGSDIVINGGNVHVVAGDDALYASGNSTVTTYSAAFVSTGATTTVTGPGKLTLRSYYEEGMRIEQDATVTLQSANVEVYGVHPVKGESGSGSSMGCFLTVDNATLYAVPNQSDAGYMTVGGLDGVTLHNSVYANPDGYTDPTWFDFLKWEFCICYDYFPYDGPLLIQPDPTGVKGIVADPSASVSKALHNGRVVIRKAGKQYTLQGTEIALLKGGGNHETFKNYFRAFRRRQRCGRR